MYYNNGFVYGNEPATNAKISAVKPLDDMIMLITFNTGEERLFDASILTGPVYAPLCEKSVFMSPEIDHGVVTWANGTIDCAPEYMFQHSYEYSHESQYA